MRLIGFARGAAALAMAGALAACGGGSEAPQSDGAAAVGGSGFGRLSVSITDAAVDSVSAVNLRVTGLQLRVQGAPREERVEIDLRQADGSALEFNLLDFQHGATFELFDDERIPAGVYDNARLLLEAPARTPRDCAAQEPLAGSHVIEVSSGGPVPIFVPSGANNGVKLVRPFEVPADGTAEIVIDFDLRQALHKPRGQTCYFLRPVFRVEATSATGRIAGSVDASLLDGSNGQCSDDDPDTGNAVYVYRGFDQVPGDLDAVDDGDGTPVATATVVFDADSNEYRYRASFLAPEEYTLAFTCKADLDRLPDEDGATADEREGNDDLSFQQVQNAVVTARETTEVNFTP